MPHPDLSGARAKLQWANYQITILGAQIQSFMDNNVKEVRPDPESKLRKITFYRHHVAVPLEIKTATGMIVQAQRDSLDYLAVALARKNGAVRVSQVEFPICDSDARFADKGTRRKIELISPGDQAAIIALKPYKGGNNLLYALHWLSNKSKHRDLITTTHNPVGAVFRSTGGRGYVRNMTVKRGYSDTGELGSFVHLDADPNIKLDITFEVAFREIPEAGSQPVIETLRDFSSLANDIIDLFDRP